MASKTASSCWDTEEVRCEVGDRVAVDDCRSMVFESWIGREGEGSGLAVAWYEYGEGVSISRSTGPNGGGEGASSGMCDSDCRRSSSL